MRTLTLLICLLPGATPAGGFGWHVDELERRCSERTRVLVLSSPSNPTGAGYGRDALKALTDVLLRHPHVWVLSDDMYEHIAFPGFTFSTPAQIAPAPRV